MKNFLLILLVFSCLLACQDQKKTVPSSTEYLPYEYSLFFGENEAGYFNSSRDAEGAYQFVFEFNDRGRGPHLEETVQLDGMGWIQSLHIVGHNYLKDTVNESFQLNEGRANWKSTSETGDTEAKDAFFIGVNSGLGNTELLIRKLLTAPNQAVDLYPSGSVKISEIEAYTIADSLNLKLIEFTGIAFEPNYIWMDQDNRFFAAPSTWLSCIRRGYEEISEELLDKQTDKQKAYYKKMANALTETPEGELLIKNVGVFDSELGVMVPNQYVLVSGNTIQEVGTGEAPEAARVIDGTGKTLLPGLFDMHGHLSRSDGILNLAAGVTSVRDLANSFDLPEIRAEFDANTVMGPRIQIMCGFIDQAGPYAGPIGKIINNLDEGLAAVEFYHERGYEQIKLYSSIDPSWVKPLADKTHELGMRLSGHIPAYMLAEDAVRSGYDEIQHVNMVALNFMSDTIDTRTPLRFSMIGEAAHTIAVDGEDFKNFVALLKEKNTVIDPTVSFFEGMLSTKAGEPDPQFEMVLDRLPIQVKRGFYSGGLPIPEGKEQDYKNSFLKLLEITKALHDAGVVIVAGTDAMVGFGLHSEIENYVRAGIPANEVLQIATFQSAEVIGIQDKFGSIKAGKLADMILVDGNPLKRIEDIRRVEWTIKNGQLYNAKKLYQAVGVEHFK